MTEPPEAFGQHVNAEISSALEECQVLLSTLVGMSGASGGGGAGGSIADKVMQVCESLTTSLPDEVDYDDIRERTADQGASATIVVLMQEIERYNKLLRQVRDSIKQLQRGLQGFVVISEEQEQVMHSLFGGTVPQSWLKCYPSMKPLSTWTTDLTERIDQLNQWGLFGAPKVFWLGGFTFPTGFLTALLQTSARKNMISVDTLSFEYLVQGHDESAIANAPKEGSYIRSMILDGAKWDTNGGCLSEPEPMMLYAPMPIVHFKPVAKKKATMEGLYQCPLYLYPVRTGTRERPSFMIWVELKSGAVDGSFWVKRGTALLLATA